LRDFDDYRHQSVDFFETSASAISLGLVEKRPSAWTGSVRATADASKHPSLQDVFSDLTKADQA
jgi:hypothetical protein